MREQQFAPTTKWYSVRELARETNMSVAFWRKRIWRKDIEFDHFGRCVRITEDALKDYLARRKAKYVSRLGAGT